MRTSLINNKGFKQNIVLTISYNRKYRAADHRVWEHLAMILINLGSHVAKRLCVRPHHGVTNAATCVLLDKDCLGTWPGILIALRNLSSPMNMRSV